MTEILIENDQEEIEITPKIEELIKKCVIEVCEFEGCDFDAEVSVTIVDEEEIKALNKEHRDKDSITDVLSFPMLDFDENGEIIDCDYDFDDELVVLGDIVICAKRAKEQAQEYGHSFQREMAFLTVHSMLHLLGYDHEEAREEEEQMFCRQREILEKMGITRD